LIKNDELEGKVEERTAEQQRIIEESRAENSEHKRAEDTNRRLAWIVESTDVAVLTERLKESSPVGTRRSNCY
jgi:C4-dicarboxylate-specific signal transduction histidine kinase